MENNMKRLIVLSVSVTLLAFLPGCSILRKHGVEPCDATSSLTSKLHRLRLRNILPWRSATSPGCVECNEGFSEVGYSDANVVEGGQVIDGGYVSDSYATPAYSEPVYSEPVYSEPVYAQSPIDTSSLYEPERVGPIVISEGVQPAQSNVVWPTYELPVPGR